jgi:surfactin synthase thioesterase subunit
MQQSPWIRRFRPAPGAAVRLVCLPHAGGSATSYVPMTRALEPDVDVLSIQYPGRQDRLREPCLGSITELADAVARELAPWTDRPMALFGHSMGATVAFEVARRLPAPLVGLFASSRRGPSCPSPEGVHRLDDAAFLAELRATNGTHAELLDDEEIVAMVLPTIRADYTAVEIYRCEPGVRIPVPVTAMIGDSDHRTTLEQAKVWAEHTTAGFDLKVFPGGHFYLNEDLDPVIAAVRDRLAAWTRPAAR